MKKILILSVALLFALIGCDDSSDSNDSDKVNVRLASKVKQSRTVVIDSDLTVDEYNVTFYKVEIGNSEDDKFTLWEDSAGKLMNIAADEELLFDNVNKAEPGDYNYCRFTIATTLELKGTYQGDSGTATEEVHGNHDNISGDGTKAVYLFGTAEVNDTNEYLITEKIKIQEGSKISFVFDIKDYVSYDQTNGLQLDGPKVELITE